MKKIIVILLSLNLNAQAADFTVQFETAPNSINNSHIPENTISSSKIANFIAEVLAAVRSSPKSSYTPGQLITVMTPNCPEGTLPADGQDLDRSVYSSLFSVMGTAYGSANSSSFKLPNLKGVFLRGSGNTYDPNFASRSTPTFPVANPSKVGSYQGDATRLLMNGAGYNSNPEGDSPLGIIAHRPGQFMAEIFVDNWGGSIPYRTTLRNAMDSSFGRADETRPRNISVTYCIAY